LLDYKAIAVTLQALSASEGSRKLRFLDYKAIAVPLQAWSGPEGSRKLRFLDYKAKAVPLQSWSGPEGSRKSRFPDFMTTTQNGGKVVSLTHRPPLPPRKCSCYSFLLEAESTPGS
jgi:hypothetical protein